MSTVAQAPARSFDQRMDALRRANEVRSERGRFKKQLRAMSPEAAALKAAEMVGAPPWWMESMTALALLLSIPRVGRVRAVRALKTNAVSASKTLGGLSQRQQLALIDYLIQGPK